MHEKDIIRSVGRLCMHGYGDLQSCTVSYARLLASQRWLDARHRFSIMSQEVDIRSVSQTCRALPSMTVMSSITFIVGSAFAASSGGSAGVPSSSPGTAGLQVTPNPLSQLQAQSEPCAVRNRFMNTVHAAAVAYMPCSISRSCTS